MFRSWLVGAALLSGVLGGCKSDAPATDSDTDPPTDSDPPTDTDATSEPGPPWDLTVIGQGYSGGNGQTLLARIADEDLVLIDEASTTITGGGWQVRFRDVIDPGEPGYWVGWWVDLDADGSCGGGDVAFLQRVSGITEDWTETHTFSSGGIDPTACNGFP